MVLLPALSNSISASWFDQLRSDRKESVKLTTSSKRIESNDELTLETVALKSQQYTIHIINSVDKTKLARNTSLI